MLRSSHPLLTFPILHTCTGTGGVYKLIEAKYNELSDIIPAVCGTLVSNWGALNPTNANRFKFKMAKKNTLSYRGKVYGQFEADFKCPAPSPTNSPSLGPTASPTLSPTAAPLTPAPVTTSAAPATAPVLATDGSDGSTAALTTAGPDDLAPISTPGAVTDGEGVRPATKGPGNDASNTPPSKDDDDLLRPPTKGDDGTTATTVATTTQTTTTPEPVPLEPLAVRADPFSIIPDPLGCADSTGLRVIKTSGFAALLRVPVSNGLGLDGKFDKFGQPNAAAYEDYGCLKELPTYDDNDPSQLMVRCTTGVQETFLLECFDSADPFGATFESGWKVLRVVDGPRKDMPLMESQKGKLDRLCRDSCGDIETLLREQISSCNCDGNDEYGNDFGLGSRCDCQCSETGEDGQLQSTRYECKELNSGEDVWRPIAGTSDRCAQLVAPPPPPRRVTSSVSGEQFCQMFATECPAQYIKDYGSEVYEDVVETTPDPDRPPVLNPENGPSRVLANDPLVSTLRAFSRAGGRAGLPHLGENYLLYGRWWSGSPRTLAPTHVPCSPRARCHLMC